MNDSLKVLAQKQFFLNHSDESKLSTWFDYVYHLLWGIYTFKIC